MNIEKEELQIQLSIAINRLYFIITNLTTTKTKRFNGSFDKVDV